MEQGHGETTKWKEGGENDPQAQVREAEHRTPNAERRTPNAERRDTDGKKAK